MTETVGDWGEKRVVALISETFGPLHGAAAQLGIGDDAAVVTPPYGQSVAISTDRVPGDLLALRLGLMGLHDLGRYLVEVNVSDVVAMGAEPCGVLLNMGMPPDFAIADLRDLLDGIKDRAQELRVPVLGGDTKVAARLDLVGVAFGTVPWESVVRRSGAAEGDLLFVTGPLGGFGAALAYFYREDRTKSLPGALEDRLLESLIRPSCRADLVQSIRHSCTACIDITDGLGGALRELELASHCEFDIDFASIPLHEGVEPVATILGLNPAEILFSIGLDLELLGCCPPSMLPTGFHGIGMTRVKTGLGSLVANAGVLSRLPPDSFEHFSHDARSFIAGGQGLGDSGQSFS